MRAFVTIYSKVFLEENDDTWSARPSNSLTRFLHSGEGSARWISQISDSHISIGDPVAGDDMLLYLPQWFMESAGIEDGSEIELEFKRSEEMPKATSLTFRMLGSGAPDIDIRDLLEEPLSQLGVLQVGQIIPVPTLEGSMLILESCDPDGLVFLDGAEIALDIINDEPPETEKEQELSAPEPFEEDTPVIPPVYAPACAKPKFVPFQGLGNKLGS